MIVYVVAYETPGSCGGHDWFYDPADADKDYKQIVESKDYETVVQFEAEVPDHDEGTITIEAITDLIDAHCWQHTLAELHGTRQDLTEEEATEQFIVVLNLTLPLNDYDNPTQWDWQTLLDLTHPVTVMGCIAATPVPEATA